MKKKIFLSSVVMTGLLAVGAIGILPASAQEATDYPTIIQKLADRFGLNVEEVQDVFEEERAEHHAQMLDSFEDRLSQAVTDGKITEEQKQAILNKHEELTAKMEELRNQNISRDEMHEQMRAYREELKTWAEEQGIEFTFMARFGDHHHGGMFLEKLD
ncbi:hypothetical protein A2803_02120 [Candidatus Woesebacteria bacterium RIFCSPHIGHO2_01_FULL_44_21]|uniref:DUF5667 domain-containing protein n=1 Tax=Candidatus Woesebacteria bacterium RIFCSPHIGHO2_01_FULL_44_21 TaxID=1802503 RepID=A0A1F7YW55_9BACT|nr:MAG: hypothetical protein A2803_02120 [Candidatus Woesebacteria bacterium RIFCSPHIGHO2_01_FULL_44_21]OGM69478.1 MAG: hypothetical protein A2897_03955 [Candidatus Woesebacteria bacterium RIFCSPLOWO2_01_FULL_44_24b]